MYSLPLIKQSNQLDTKCFSPASVNQSSICQSTASQSGRVFDKNITVRFELNELDTVVAQVYHELTTIGEMLDDVSAKFQMLPKYLSIKLQKFGTNISKATRLYQVCTNDFGILDAKLSLSDLAIHINESIRFEHEKIRLDTNLYFR